MTFILLAVNSFSCFAIFWVCGTFLLVRDGATCLRQLVIQVGLLLAMVGAFSNGLAPYTQPVGLVWPSVVLRLGIAMIALAQYDKAFGIVAQARRLALRVRMMPVQVSAWWAERIDIARRHARLKR